MRLQPLSIHGAAVALGYFDGVHLGHRQILSAAARWARENGAHSTAFTFRFAGRRTKEPDLLTLSERERRMSALGVESIDCEEFDAIAELGPEEFVDRILVEKLGARAVFCGDNFRFGAHAAGDAALLRTLCAQRGIEVQVFALLEAGGAPVSATRIRALLSAGRLGEANELLGEPYAVDLPVVHGKKLGSSLGFPTLNQVYPAGMQLPAEGVYLTSTVLAGAEYPSATGLGSRPTVNGTGVTCESFLCRWQGDAYGSTPRVVFHRYLWPVRRYASLDELKACIAEAARRSCEAFDARAAAGK